MATIATDALKEFEARKKGPNVTAVHVHYQSWFGPVIYARIAAVLVTSAKYG